MVHFVCARVRTGRRLCELNMTATCIRDMHKAGEQHLTASQAAAAARLRACSNTVPHATAAG